MKWTYKQPIQNELGDLRVRTKFAWIPVRVYDQWLWMSSYKVLQQYSRIVKSQGPWYRIRHYHILRWSTILASWIDEDIELIHKNNEIARVAEMNSRGAITWKQFINMPKDLSIQEFLSGVGSTQRGKNETK